MLFNSRVFGKTDYLLKSPFLQTWDDQNIVPPPPGSEVRITDAGDNRAIDNGDIRITD